MMGAMKMISLFHSGPGGAGVRSGVPELAWRWGAALFGRRREGMPDLAQRTIELALDAHSLCRIAGHVRGVRIDCSQGRLWLTQAGAAADVILQPGQGFTAVREGAIVVQPVPTSAAQDEIALGTIAVASGAARFTIHRGRNAVAPARSGLNLPAEDLAERWERLVFIALWLCSAISVGYCLETLLSLP